MTTAMLNVCKIIWQNYGWIAVVVIVAAFTVTIVRLVPQKIAVGMDAFLILILLSTTVFFILCIFFPMFSGVDGIVMQRPMP